MSIILLILKIIGITLLCIIGLILLILGLILFVPIRYSVKVKKPREGGFEETDVAVGISWLLHILNIHVKYLHDLFYKVRLFIFTVYKSDTLKTDRELEKEKKKEEKKKKKAEKKRLKAEKKRIKAEKKRNKNISLNNLEDNNHDADIVEIASVKENSTNETKEDNLDTESDEKMSFADRIIFIINKIFEFLFDIPEKVLSVLDKINDIWNNLDYYIDAVNDERNKIAFSLCLSQVSNILKNIKPKKIKGELIIGSEDPYNMGKMMSIYGILFPVIHDKIQVVPEYDKDVMAGDLYIKGRITCFVLVRALYKVYFNKDVRRMRRIFKKEKQ